MVLIPSLALAGVLPDIDTPLKSGSRQPRDAAVVVGIEEYAFLPDVPHASRDAAAFYDFLVFTRGIPSSRISRVTTANREKILRAAEEAAEQAGPDGTVWFYFAGHGGASPTTSERMLMGVDVQADLASFASRSVSLDALRTTLTASGSKAVFILDTCYTGQGRSGADLLAGKRFSVPSYALTASADVLEWSAASANQFSGPLPAAGHGAFTYTVIGALRGWADGVLDDEPDGAVTAEEASLYVEQALRSLQVRDQTPVLSVDSPASWVLAEHRKPEPAPVLKPAPAPAAAATGNFDNAGDIAAQIRAAEALKKKLAAEVQSCLDQKAKDLEAQAATDWDALAELREVAKSSPEAWQQAAPQIRRFADLYSNRKVTCESQLETRSQQVQVAAVHAAQTWLGERPSATQAVVASTPEVWTGLGDLRMQRIRAGSFTMGSPADEPGRMGREKPHQVTLTRDFYMATTEVTQALYLDVMGRNPVAGPCGTVKKWNAYNRNFTKLSMAGKTHPVTCVSWCDAVAFANALSKRDGLEPVYSGVESCESTKSKSVRWRAGSGYRLPTEAEWEYAARAGKPWMFAGAASYGSVCQVGNVNGTESGSKALHRECNDGHDYMRSVGKYRPNEWGLYDMSGNVWEWVWDGYKGYKGDATDPVGPSSATRCARSGSFLLTPELSRVAFRGRFPHDSKQVHLGLRLARNID